MIGRKKSCRILLAVGIAVLSGEMALAAEPLPEGWMGGNVQEYEVGIDRKVFNEGKASAYIRSKVDSPKGFGTIVQTFDAENYLGKRVRMSALARADEIKGWAGLWMRVDGEGDENFGLSFDNMHDRPSKGTQDWRRYSIVLDVPNRSKSISFGILFQGMGHAWVDDFRFDIVGKDVPTTGQKIESRLPDEPLSPGFEK